MDGAIVVTCSRVQEGGGGGGGGYVCNPNYENCNDDGGEQPTDPGCDVYDPTCSGGGGVAVAVAVTVPTHGRIQIQTDIAIRI